MREKPWNSLSSGENVAANWKTEIMFTNRASK